jgi:hypothetical protein
VKVSAVRGGNNKESLEYFRVELMSLAAKSHVITSATQGKDFGETGFNLVVN